MHASRRTLLGGALAAAAYSLAPTLAINAQEATPVAGGTPVPGYGIARVRTHGSAELAQAVYPDVMTRFLPATAAVPGYVGYIFAFDDEDPATTLNITLLADAAAGDAAAAVATDYVSGMDPRLAPETPLQLNGSIPIYRPGELLRTALPPFLNGCHLAIRHWATAPGTDMDAYARVVNDGLVEVLRVMDGFVLYCWIVSEDSRAGINIWETAEQAQAGNDAAAAWSAENSTETRSGEATVHSGKIAYSDILGRD